MVPLTTTLLSPDHGAEGDAKRIEDLVSSVQPHCRLQQHLQLKYIILLKGQSMKKPSYTDSYVIKQRFF
jgi:hypothetical protein